MGQSSLFDDDVPGTSDPEMGSLNPGAAPSAPSGQSMSRNGQRIPRMGGGDLPYAFDWSTNRGVVAVDPQGYKWGPFSTLERLLLELPQGVRLVGESTFDSYDVRQRQRNIDLAASRGIDLLTVPARGNTRRRAAAGFAEKTSQTKQTDYEDALAIQHAAAAGAHLKRPVIVDADWSQVREQARERIIHLRYSGQKDQYAEDLLYQRAVPHFTWQPDERRIALGRDGSYSPVIVAAVGVVAEFVANRADFERLAGLYAHGYPSQFRSDLYYWGWSRQPKKRERISLSVYRREIRWLFHCLRCDNPARSSNPHPETVALSAARASARNPPAIVAETSPTTPRGTPPAPLPQHANHSAHAE